MLENTNVKTLDRVVVRFAGDSGDGMQLAGNIFSNVSAGEGNQISTFPDYPAEIRAPQGSLSGVSGFQVHIGRGVHTPGDQADVLVAMNPAALKTNLQFLKSSGIIICDVDKFQKADLEKAQFATDDPVKELGIDPRRIMLVQMTSLVKHALADSGMDMKSILKSRNMFALGLICWLFDRPLDSVLRKLQAKFAKKPAVYEANAKVIRAGWDCGHNTHSSMSTYRVETESEKKGTYTDVSGNTATAWGLIMASQKSGLPLFLGSYPITPATDILHELAKRKDLGVKACQMEDEIAGLPTKTEQTDLLQALYGRNGESPVCVMAAVSPTDCFYMAFEACRIALEHMTPVILLTDAFIANGSSAWRIPEDDEFPEIKPHYVTPEQVSAGWKPFDRDENTLVRYWAVPGTEGAMHRVGGLEKDYNTSVISTDGKNHQRMVDASRAKIARIACRHYPRGLGRHLRPLAHCRRGAECHRPSRGSCAVPLHQPAPQECHPDALSLQEHHRGRAELGHVRGLPAAEAPRQGDKENKQSRRSAVPGEGNRGRCHQTYREQWKVTRQRDLPPPTSRTNRRHAGVPAAVTMPSSMYSTRLWRKWA